jgi:hypothetical protein
MVLDRALALNTIQKEATAILLSESTLCHLGLELTITGVNIKQEFQKIDPGTLWYLLLNLEGHRHRYSNCNKIQLWYA